MPKPCNISQKIIVDVVALNENKSILEAAVLMTQEFIGSVVITGQSGITGVFTERDLMMRVVGMKKHPEKVKIKEVMTKDLITVSPDETADRCLDLMKKHRCRHLLVYKGKQYLGIVSLRDIVALLIEEKEALIEELQACINK